MRITKISPQATAVFNNLDATFSALPTPIPVGRSAPPRDSDNKTHEPPYVFITPIPGGLPDGSLTNPQELGDQHFQVTAAAHDEESCLNMIDIARESLTNNPITVTGWKVMSMRLILSSQGAILDDTSSDPGFMAFDRWALRTSPS